MNFRKNSLSENSLRSKLHTESVTHYIRTDSAITLIALVITIIVLLILVGVSLSFITGSDGIITKAERATFQHEQAAEKDLLELAYWPLLGDYKAFNEKITSDAFEKELEDNGPKVIVIENEKDKDKFVVTFEESRNVYYIDITDGKTEYRGKYDKEDDDIEIKEGDIEFESSTGDWTKENVMTTITVNDEVDMTNFVLQYSKDGKEWFDYTEPIESEKPETIYVRIKHNLTEQTKLQSSISIPNIDKLPPTGSFEVTSETTKSITLKVTASDQTETEDNACSGIKGYYYSKDNGVTWTDLITDASYTFDNLTQGTTYNFKVKIEDNAGNVTEAVGVSGTTEIVPGASSSNVSYTTTWSGSNAIIRFTTTSEFTIETSTNGSTWTSTNPITVSSGTQIYVRLSDGTNGGTSYAAVKPLWTGTVTYNANGGTGAPSSQTAKHMSTVTVNFTTVPTRTGYTFQGWATSSSATTATYTSSGTKTFTMGKSNVTLYAVWQTAECDGTISSKRCNKGLTVVATDTKTFEGYSNPMTAYTYYCPVHGTFGGKTYISGSPSSSCWYTVGYYCQKCGKSFSSYPSSHTP